MDKNLISSNKIDDETQKKSSTEDFSNIVLKLAYKLSTIWLQDGFQFKEFSILLAITLPLFLYGLLSIEWISGLWSPLGIFFYGTYIFMFPLFLSVYIKSKTFVEDREKKSEIYLLSVLILGMGFLLAFSQFCRYIFIVFGGFSSVNTGYWHWIRYGVQSIAEAILFDIPSIYEWNISEVKPTSFWTKTLIFVVRTVIEFFIVAKALDSLKNAGKTSQSLPHQLYNNYFSFLFSKFGELIAFFLWSIPLALIIEGIVFEKIIWDKSLAIFVNLSISLSGFWVTWINIQALFFAKGKWSKLFSLAGVCLGIWLVSSYWDYIFVFLRK